MYKTFCHYLVLTYWFLLLFDHVDWFGYDFINYLVSDLLFCPNHKIVINWENIILVSFQTDNPRLLVIMWSGGMIRDINVHEVLYWCKNIGSPQNRESPFHRHTQSKARPWQKVLVHTKPLNTEFYGHKDAQSWGLCISLHLGEVASWVPVWHWAHDNLQYYTDAEPNNEYHTLMSLQYLKRMHISFFKKMLIILR